MSSARLTPTLRSRGCHVRRRVPTKVPPGRAYQLLFLALRDEPFRYATEDMVEDEAGVQTRVQGIGRIGCTVAVSLLAPVAMVKFGDMEQLDDGSQILPQIDDNIFRPPDLG